MAILEFWLGDFRFVTLARVDDKSAPPAIVSGEVDVIERKGVNGSGIIRTGSRGKAAQYRTQVDVATMDDAQQLQLDYAAMIGNGRFDLVWNDVDYKDQHGVQYIVIDVAVTRMQFMSCMSGGLAGETSGYWVEAMWTLLPVPASTSGGP